MAFDRRAAIDALRAVLEAAPTVDGGDGAELAVDLGVAVDRIVRAGNPDALVPPDYDPVLAEDTWVPLITGEGEQAGMRIRFLALSDGRCEVWLQQRSGAIVALGIARPESLWHVGVTACSASTAATEYRTREGA